MARLDIFCQVTAADALGAAATVVGESGMVLEIENRTENWKTARCLSSFFVGDRAVLLAHRLGEPCATPPADVKIELFWKGIRDWCAGREKRECGERLVESYRILFVLLRYLWTRG